jgi:hypothetical protein
MADRRKYDLGSDPGRRCPRSIVRPEPAVRALDVVNAVNAQNPAVPCGTAKIGDTQSSSSRPSSGMAPHARVDASSWSEEISVLLTQFALQKLAAWILR